MSHSNAKAETMKCYFCKRDVPSSMRVFVTARNGREKSKFRDLCQECYKIHARQHYRKTTPVTAAAKETR